MVAKNHIRGRDRHSDFWFQSKIEVIAPPMTSESKYGIQTRSAQLAYHDSAFWGDDGTGSLNPRQLQAKRNLHPGESVDTLLISLVPATPFPFSISDCE